MPNDAPSLFLHQLRQRGQRVGERFVEGAILILSLGGGNDGDMVIHAGHLHVPRVAQPPGADALRQKQVRQRSFTESTGKKDTALGTVLIVLAVVFLLAIIAGIVVLIMLWSRGKLPPKAVAVILGVIAVIAVLALIGKAKNSQN